MVFVANPLVASPIRRSAADAVLDELQPGTAASFGRVFEVLCRATRAELIILSATCGDDNDSTEILIFRGTAKASYRIKATRVQEDVVFPTESKELNEREVRGFVAEQRDCRRFTLIVPGSTIVIEVDAEGRVASISTKAPSASPPCPVPSPPCPEPSPSGPR
jgi:hypothetical protein